MSDSVAWCILAGFKITSVFSRITYHIIESICEFVVSILEEYIHRGKKTVTVDVNNKVQKKKGKAAIKLIEVGCQNEEESEKENYNSNTNKPTVTRKNKTEDKNGDTLNISGQRFCFRARDKVVEYNLHDARKVTVSFDFYPFQDQSTLQIFGPSTQDKTSDTQNETTGNVTTSDEPLLPTSSNQRSYQPSEKEETRMHSFKRKGGFVLDNYCPDQNVFKTDYRKHTEHAEAIKLDVESKDRTDSIHQRYDASNDKMQGKGDPDKHPASPMYTKQCPPASFDQSQGTAAHIDEHAEQRRSLVPFTHQTVDKKRDYEAAGYQMQDPEPIFDQKQDKKITFNQKQIPEAIVDQKEDSQSIVDQKQCPASAVKKERPEVAVEQKQGPKTAVDEMQDPGADVEELQGPETTVNQKLGPEATLNQKKDPAIDKDQKKRQEVTVDQRQDMKRHVNKKQGLESTVDENEGHATVVYQKQDKVSPIDQSTDKKQGPPTSVDKKSPVDLTDKQQSKVGTLDQSTDKKGPPVTADTKQGGGGTFSKKNGARDPAEKNEGTAFPAEKKQVSAVPTDKKKGVAFPMNKKHSSEVTVDKKKGDETVEKTGTAASVERKQGTAVPADKKKGAVAPVNKNEGLDIPVDKKQVSAVSVDKKKDSLPQVDETIDKKKAPAAISSQKQGSAAHVHPSTSKKHGSELSTCKEQVDSKREPGYTSSAADSKSVSKGVKDKSNLKCPQGGFREEDSTQTFSKTGNETKVSESASERFAGTDVGASEIISEASQSTSGVEKVSETSGSADGVEPHSEMTQDTHGIEPTSKESRCADGVDLVSEASKEVGNFADVSEVSRKGNTHKLVSEVLEDHKAVEPNSKTSGDENNGGLYQESLADRFSHQRKSIESDESGATSGEDSLNESVNSLEKGPSIVIAPDVLLDPYMPLDMAGNVHQIVHKTGIIEKEYLQDEWDDTDKYFYDHVIEREKEMGHIDPTTFAKEPSARKAGFETKNKKEKKKSQKEEHKSQKSYGKIIDKYNPMTELPKYYDVISVVDSKYLLEKSDIKCYTKQEVTDDSKTVESGKNISDTEGSLETEQRNNERQSTKDMGNVNLLAEAALALEKEDLKTPKEEETPEKSGKTYAEMGARPRTHRRRNYH